jgi:hypothetical protein
MKTAEDAKSEAPAEAVGWFPNPASPDEIIYVIPKDDEPAHVARRRVADHHGVSVKEVAVILPKT